MESFIYGCSGDSEDRQGKEQFWYKQEKQAASLLRRKLLNTYSISNIVSSHK